jgi:hypothetical protein
MLRLGEKGNSVGQLLSNPFNSTVVYSAVAPKLDCFQALGIERYPLGVTSTWFLA